MSGVLAAVFLVFNEGYPVSGPDTDPVLQDLTVEAIRLTRPEPLPAPDDGKSPGCWR
ncbi:hypothetical protein Aglo03_11950 [Actinokineospora globicatena]|uniref:Uncharacterized protein n=1 Tax=Actinokineospora globicatena TaxID=103729 RepID=A0A9W6V7X3_9PSEU|nr:hypothetical protein Aglo03_11950 [Actinokineospora globicatena]